MSNYYLFVYQSILLFLLTVIAYYPYFFIYLFLNVTTGPIPQILLRHYSLKIFITQKKKCIQTKDNSLVTISINSKRVIPNSDHYILLNLL